MANELLLPKDVPKIAPGFSPVVSRRPTAILGTSFLRPKWWQVLERSFAAAGFLGRRPLASRETTSDNTSVPETTRRRL